MKFSSGTTMTTVLCSVLLRVSAARFQAAEVPHQSFLRATEANYIDNNDDNVLSSSSSSSSSTDDQHHHHHQQQQRQQQTSGSSPPVIATSSGKLHGTIDPALPNVHQYLGIPYAEPPVGDRRWTPPQPRNEPDADVQATKLPPSCMQYLPEPGKTLYTRDVLEYNLQGLNVTGAVSEDCLTLSVWTPANATTNTTTTTTSNTNTNTNTNTTTSSSSSGLLPVIIFIHGGAFGSGGQDVPYQVPAQWVNRDPTQVLVSIHYRLNIFGFPTAAGLDEQNYGLLDQRAAVEWVRDNVAAFGGDPDRMVLWGNSAGSISVDYYNYAYPADPIVTGLIMDSGTAFSPTPTNDTTFSNFTFVAEHVGCAGLVDNPAEQVQCMRKVDADVLEGFIAEYQVSEETPGILFRPFYDEKLVFRNYTARAEAGLQANIPAIVGSNADDGVAFAPYNVTGPNTTVAVILDLYLFFCASTETTRLRQLTPSKTPTYRYEYFGDWPNVSPRPWMGAYHASELPMLMGTHPNFRGASTPAEVATSAAFQDAFAAFARDPWQGMASVGWEPYTTLGAEQVRGFGVEGQAPAKNVQVGTLEVYCSGGTIKT